MRAIQRDDIIKVDDGFRFNCTGCNAEYTVSTKGSAIRTIESGKCKKCAKHYSYHRLEKENSELGVYQRDDGKWCSRCPDCDVEQPYTRRDHARQSATAGWSCRKCMTYRERVKPSKYQGFKLHDIESFMKGAKGRGYSWELEPEDVISMWEAQKGLCALSGLPMEKNPKTWSIDRINSSGGYTKDNTHLVLCEINMMKKDYDVNRFINLCCAVAKHRGCL